MAATSAAVARTAWREVGDGVLVAAGLGLLLLTPRNVIGDGEVRHSALQALASGSWPREKYSLVMPLLALPFEAAGRWLDSEQTVVYLFNGVVLALGVLGTWLLLRRCAAPLHRSLALLLVYGSMFPAHVNSFYGETFTAVGLGVGLLLATLASRGMTRGCGWGLAVLAVVNSPAALPAFAAVVLVQVLRTRRAWPLALLPVTIALVLVDVRLHTGGIDSPYLHEMGFPTVLPYSGRPGFTYPVGFGILAILFSFGKGLLFFCPGLFLPVRGRIRAARDAAWPFYLLSVTFVVGLVAVYCRWWAWYGGYFWGPRFFLYASVVAAVVIALRMCTPEPSTTAAAMTLLALALSSWVAVSAVLGNVGQDVCLADNYAREYLCWYSPEFSVLWTPLRDWPTTTLVQKLYIGFTTLAFVRLASPLGLRLWRDAMTAARATFSAAAVTPEAERAGGLATSA
jgi:hypothetical protein